MPSTRDLFTIGIVAALAEHGLMNRVAQVTGETCGSLAAAGGGVHAETHAPFKN